MFHRQQIMRKKQVSEYLYKKINVTADNHKTCKCFIEKISSYAKSSVQHQGMTHTKKEAIPLSARL